MKDAPICLMQYTPIHNSLGSRRVSQWLCKMLQVQQSAHCTMAPKPATDFLSSDFIKKGNDGRDLYPFEAVAISQ
jgi:hypothetical protein